MSPASEADLLLIERIRGGDQSAWTELIDRYEGRLLAYAESRIGRRTAGEDVVQETFIGFLTSLPNYDAKRPLEGWLFSIAAHKLTDHLRRQGRRPAVSLSSAADDDGRDRELPGSARRASTIARSGERRRLEEQAVGDMLDSIAAQWIDKRDFPKLKCMELLFVKGEANKDVAKLLDITEQQVANFKHDFLAKVAKGVAAAGLDPAVFPELYDAGN